MAVSVVAVGNAAGQSAGTTTSASTVSVTPTLPTGSASGDRIYVLVSANNTAGATPTNWTAVHKDTIVGTGAVSAGAGQRYESCYYRNYDGVWTMPAFTLTSAAQNTQSVASIALRKSSTDTWDTPTFTGDGEYYGTAGTAFTATSPASFTTIANAVLMAHVVTNDNVTATAGAITGTNGFTAGTVTERVDGGSASGNDVSIKLHTCIPSAAGSPAGTLTHTMTLSAASQGGVIFIQQTVTPTAPPEGNLMPSIVAWYKFDGDTSDSADSNTATINGTVTAATDKYGNTNQAYLFNGTTGYMALTQSSGLPIYSHTAPYSITAWVKATNDASYDTVYGESDGTDNVPQFVLQCNSGKLIVNCRKAGFVNTLAATSTTTMADGTWHHIVWTDNAGSAHLYIDGVEDATSFAYTAESLGTLTTSSVGACVQQSSGTPNSFLAGTLSDVRLYGRALSAGDAAALYASSTAYPTSAGGLPPVDSTDTIGVTDSVAKDAGKNFTDTAGITDTLTKDVGRTWIDVVGATDTATFAITLTSTDTDLVGISDTLTKDVGDINTDVVGVTDTVATAQDWVRSQTDPVGITDAASFGAAYVTTTADPVGVTDTVTTTQAWTRTPTDLVGATDNLTSAQDWVRSQTDLIGVIDTLTKDVGRTATDVAGITDTVAATQNWVRAPVDPVGVTDTLTKDYGDTTTDLVGVLDSVSSQQNWVRAPIDPVGLSDTATFDRSAPGAVNNTDLIDINDALTTTLAVVKTISDLVGATDALTKDAGRTQLDLTGITDAVAVQQNWVRPATDPAGITDTAAFTIVAAGAIAGADLISLSDAAPFTANYVRAFADPIGVTDAATFQIGAVTSTTDQLGIADTATFQLVSVSGIAATDQIGIADATTLLANYVRAPADPVGIAETAVVELAAIRTTTTTDPIGVTDTAAFQANLFPAAPITSGRVATVAAESRIATVGAESRIATVAAESRIATVGAESRIATVGAESRVVTATGEKRLVNV